ncbi:MAG: ATP-binding protein, partial [Anaerolineae bacterium]
VIPRVLTQGTQDTLPGIAPIWLRLDGTLEPALLLEAFLAFWREHGQALLKSAPYHEVAPHLVLMAFLHRVVNGGGSLQREYAVGMGRLDILLRYGQVRLAIELKTWRDEEPDPLTKGLSQLDAYLTGLGLDTGWLVIFDQRANQPRIAERTSTTTALTPAGRSVTVIRA